MSDLSYYESRTGTVVTSPDKVFAFVTDMRNFERFIPSGMISNWQADKESCSFRAPTIGNVNIRIYKTEMDRMVAYRGDAFKKDDFEIVLHINRNPDDLGDVKVELTADLNPMMKVFASKPILQALEKIVAGMENFYHWEDVRK